MMIDSIILAPYYWALRIRHFLYDKGMKKVNRPEIPSICLGNVTVGGTGKTPHTEMIVRMLSAQEQWAGKNIAVLSRGYKRKSKGFQQVCADGTVKDYGDEPLQIKRKFPNVTVAVDASRTEGCAFLAAPERLKESKKTMKRCKAPDFPAADLVIMDDAFQHRKIKADISIVLVDYSRPVFKDHLLPLGSLRDLPSRIFEADAVIVSKCPMYLDEWQKSQWAEALGFKNFNPATCKGVNVKGKEQYLFFTSIFYDHLTPVYPDGDIRYSHSQRLILFTGIANDTPLLKALCDSYKILRHIRFGDHHNFTTGEIRNIASIAEGYPTAVVATTEKDAQRVIDVKKVPDSLKKKLFAAPIKADFLEDGERKAFISFLNDRLKLPSRPSAASGEI